VIDHAAFLPQLQIEHAGPIATVPMGQGDDAIAQVGVLIRARHVPQGRGAHPAMHPPGDARRLEVDVVEQVLGLDVEGLRQWARDNNKPTDGVADPIDIARLGVFLLSDAAKGISGQIVAVDGATIVRQ